MLTGFPAHAGHALERGGGERSGDLWFFEKSCRQHVRRVTAEHVERVTSTECTKIAIGLMNTPTTMRPHAP
jgi:hypothetical protein